MSARSIRVVGGGLAGLALGIALRRREIPVTVEEAGTYPRHKVCGEFVSGVPRGLLELLGIDDVFDDACRHRSVLWRRGENAFRRDLLPEPAWGLSRHAMDARLAERFEAEGGDLECGRRARLEDKGEGVVWAAGRSVERTDWLGLKGHFKGLALEADLEMRLGDQAYLGASAVEGGWVNVCGLFLKREGIRLTRETALIEYVRAAGLEAFAGRLEQSEARLESLVAVAALRFGSSAAKGEGAWIGDAFALMPPFTGNGMAMALEGAALAARPLSAYASGRVDWRTACAELRLEQRRRFGPRLRNARLLHRWVYSQLGQGTFVALSRLRLLPFSILYRMTRAASGAHSLEMSQRHLHC